MRHILGLLFCCFMVFLISACGPAPAIIEVTRTPAPPRPVDPPPMHADKDVVTVMYWASYCNLCIEEIIDYAELQAVMDSNRIHLVGVQVDNPWLPLPWGNVLGDAPGYARGTPFHQILFKNNGEWFIYWQGYGYLGLHKLVDIVQEIREANK